MTFRNLEIGLSVEIDDVLVEKIKSAGLAHYPKEFGGVLVGSYLEENTCVRISEMILPQKYTSTRYAFERGAEGLKEKLEAFFQKEQPLIYVGEWHTHPDGAPIPSGTDVMALKQIVTAETVNIDSPVMLIVGLRPNHIILAMYVYFNNKIYKYENT